MRSTGHHARQSPRVIASEDTKGGESPHEVWSRTGWDRHHQGTISDLKLLGKTRQVLITIVGDQHGILDPHTANT